MDLVSDSDDETPFDSFAKSTTEMISDSDDDLEFASKAELSEISMPEPVPAVSMPGNAPKISIFAIADIILPLRTELGKRNISAESFFREADTNRDFSMSAKELLKATGKIFNRKFKPIDVKLVKEEFE